jgi:hypothetical protein
MLKALFTYIIFSLSVFGKCQQNRVNLIIYSDFAEPKKVYTSLIDEISELKLTDSIKVIGRPLMENTIDIQIDTAKAMEFGLTVAEVREKISVSNKFDIIDELIYMSITTNLGSKIPLSAIASYHLSCNYYKPHIFVLTPENYYLKGKKAVKIEFYCMNGKKKELIEFIKNNMDRISDIGLKTNYEFIE